MIINNGYTTMKNIDMSMLSDGEYRLYMEIYKSCFGNKESFALLQSTMAQKLRVCIRTIQRRLKSLIDKGFISVRRRGHKSSIYTILKGKVESQKQGMKKLMTQLTCSKKSNVNSQDNHYKKEKKYLKCANFTQRNYDYDSLEKQLLGWQQED